MIQKLEAPFNVSHHLRIRYPRKHPMDELKALETMGLTIPSVSYIVGSIVFGIIGYIGYRYGKKAKLNTPKWIGVALMLYPYAISETWMLYVVGCALCVGLYAYRK